MHRTDKSEDQIAISNLNMHPTSMEECTMGLGAG